jgi:hypothetical protein
MIGLVVVLLLLVGLADRRDRFRRHAPMSGADHYDWHRPIFGGRSSSSTWEPPTIWIDHPDGAGTPPGIDEDDRPPPR